MVQESKRKPVAPIQVRVWAVKILSSMVSASMVDASGWEGVECGTWCSLESRRSMIEEILTGVIARHRRKIMLVKWEERKGNKVQYLINTWIIQDKTIGGEKS